MTRIIILIIKVVVLFNLGVLGFAQVNYEIEPVVVTATRYPVNLIDVTRTVTIIDSGEIKKYASLHDILQSIGGILLKIRSDDIQADPSIRGSTFQQVLVLIDGVRVNDPQTAHHNLNIPIPLNEIERIEVLRGTSSSLYGSDACGGVINIITKRAGKIIGGLKLGSFAYKDFFGKVAFNRFSIDFETKSSDGHEPGYEYSQYNIATKFNASVTNNYEFSIFSGYLNKGFGARNFYAPYPSWEKNQTFFINLNNQWLITPIFLLNPILSFRTHIDTFVLDRNNPLFYANRHQSFTYGTQVIGNLDLKNLGFFVFGTEIYRDSLNSTRLGQRHLQRTAFFGQLEKKFLNNKIILVSGFRDDYYWNIANAINPHLSIGYKILPMLKLRGVLGSSFRTPSFTELYYQDPANKGDSLLKPESGLEYELGIDFQNKYTIAQISFYHRLNENNIDWVKKSNETVWQVKNIGKTRFYGFEPSAKLTFAPWIKLSAGLSYIYIIKELPEEYISKYALQVPRINNYLNITTFSTFDFNLIWSHYFPHNTRLLLNTALNRDFTISKQIKLVFSFVIDNLLDKRYEDFQNVPLPGRSLKIGAKIKER